MNFIIEDKVADLLEAIVNSRMKKATKQKAAEVSKKYIQAGFRLKVLLEVAPEVVAKEAIGRIQEEDKVDEVINKAHSRKKYLNSYHGVHDQLKEHECESIHHATYNKKANTVCDITEGSRKSMSREEELKLMIFQHKGELELMHNKDVKRFGAVDLAVKAGERALLS